MNTQQLTDFQNESLTQIRKELASGEEIRWTGGPKQGLLLTTGDAVMIPFSLLWGGFAIFWEVMAITMGAPFFFALFGLPFVAIGLYLIFGRFFHDAWTRKKTLYAVTNQRVIIYKGGKTSSIQSIFLNDLNGISLVKKSDGTGSIFFGPNPNKSALTVRIPSALSQKGKEPALSLEMIENVQDVYDQITFSQPNQQEGQSGFF